MTNSEKDISEKERERDALVEGLNSTKPHGELKEQEAELQRQNEEDQAIINYENTSSFKRVAAEGRVAERTEELARLQMQIEERERALLLRERIKEISKKKWRNGDTIALAAVFTIVTVIETIMKALKDTGKSLGNGLKELGIKKASFLPGLLG